MLYQKDVRKAVTSVMKDYDKYKKARNVYKGYQLTEVVMLLIMMVGAVTFGLFLASSINPSMAVIHANTPATTDIMMNQQQYFDAVMCGFSMLLFGFGLYGMITGRMDTIRQREALKEKYPTWDTIPSDVVDDIDDL